MSTSEPATRLRPVFIIGSPRSGTSILTWALGQHPNLLPLEETRWLEKLAVDLHATYQLGRKHPTSQLATMGIELSDFYAAFGAAANDMILSHGRHDSEFARNVDPDSAFLRYRSPGDPKARWVDGTPEYSLHVYELLQLFPEARFIHMLRDVRLVVSSLVHFDRAGASARKAEAAYAEWYGFTRACLDAERAFGSATVMRLRHADLVAQPEQAVRRCLDFVGEPFAPDCLEPLQQVINTSGAASEATTPEHHESSIVAKAIGLSEELEAESTPHYEPDRELQADLGAKSPLTAAAYLVPVDGPVYQEGPAAGFGADYWIDGALTATFFVANAIRKVTVEGDLPTIPDTEEVTLDMAIDGNEFREKFRLGQEISWTVDCAIPRGRRVTIKLGSSATFCPHREGLSDDRRELVLFLKRIIVSA